MKPTVGRIVLYFADDERRRNLGPALPAKVWPAIVTFVHERGYDASGEETGPLLISLTAFPPPHQKHPTLITIDRAAVPLAGTYDLEDLMANPEWLGCWNWPPREPIE